MMAISQEIESTISYEGVISFPLPMVGLITDFIPCGCLHDQTGRVSEFCIPCSSLRFSTTAREAELSWIRVYGTTLGGLCVSVRHRVRHLACNHRMTAGDFFQNHYPYVAWHCVACTSAARVRDRKRVRGE
jgi:hypothetical protein